jgi:hypothetical protein
MNPRRLQQRENHIADMILRYVRLNPDARPYATDQIPQTMTANP